MPKLSLWNPNVFRNFALFSFNRWIIIQAIFPVCDFAERLGPQYNEESFRVPRRARDQPAKFYYLNLIGVEEARSPSAQIGNRWQLTSRAIIRTRFHRCEVSRCDFFVRLEKKNILCRSEEDLFELFLQRGKPSAVLPFSIQTLC